MLLIDIGIGIGIGISTLLGTGLVLYGIRWRHAQTVVRRESDAIIMLKNALLTYALATARVEDIDDRYNYSEFDGSTLPNLAGCSLDNACFSYIVDKHELMRDPWYTTIMMDKLEKRCDRSEAICLSRSPRCFREETPA